MEAKRRIILLLIFLRFLLSFSHGYIHPDEFFQSYEVMASDFIAFDGVKINKPWEYNISSSSPSFISNKSPNSVNANTEKDTQSEKECAVDDISVSQEQYKEQTIYRSAFPILLSHGWIFALLSKANHILPSTGRVLLYTPRLVAFTTSILFDYILYLICLSTKRDPFLALLVQNTSWISLLMFSRSFSNINESLIFYTIYYFVTLLHDKSNRPMVNKLSLYFAIGFLSGLGIFVRITFPGFIAVPLLFLLVQITQNRKLVQSDKKFPLVQFIIASGFGFIIATSIAVFVDSYYVSYVTKQPLSIGSAVFAPFNNLLYNLKTENLAKHGLHPRYLHSVVNLQILFGPCVIVILLKFITSIRFFLNDKSVLMPLLTITIAVGILSFFPHQEPRFLIPLILPIVLIMHDILKLHNEFLLSASFRRYFMIGLLTWLLFNSVMCIFFGMIHQGGIVNMLFYISDITASCEKVTSVITYQTYMSPQFLIGQQSSKCFHVQNYGSDLKELVNKISALKESSTNYLIISPCSSKQLYTKELQNEYQIIKRYWPNFSAEAFEGMNPSKLKSMGFFEFISLCMFQEKN